MHEIGRCGLSDFEQFQFAVQEGRILITRNRDDFRYLVETRFKAGERIPGVLIAPHTLPNKHPEHIAYALKQWAERWLAHGHNEFQGIDFLSRAVSG